MKRSTSSGGSVPRPSSEAHSTTYVPLSRLLSSSKVVMLAPVDDHAAGSVPAAQPRAHVSFQTRRGTRTCTQHMQLSRGKPPRHLSASPPPNMMPNPTC